MQDSTWHALWQGIDLISAMEWMSRSLGSGNLEFRWRQERESAALAALKSWTVRKRVLLEHVHATAPAHPQELEVLRMSRCD